MVSDEPEILSYAITPFCPTSADGLHKVRIVRGPLSGLEGLVEGLRPQQRIEILLAVLGRVTVPKGDIAAI